MKLTCLRLAACLAGAVVAACGGASPAHPSEDHATVEAHAPAIPTPRQEATAGHGETVTSVQPTSTPTRLTLDQVRSLPRANTPPRIPEAAPVIQPRPTPTPLPETALPTSAPDNAPPGVPPTSTATPSPTASPVPTLATPPAFPPPPPPIGTPAAPPTEQP